MSHGTSLCIVSPVDALQAASVVQNYKSCMSLVQVITRHSSGEVGSGQRKAGPDGRGDGSGGRYTTRLVLESP